MYKRSLFVLSAVVLVGACPALLLGQSASKSSSGSNQPGMTLSNEDLPAADAAAPSAATKKADVTLSDQDLGSAPPTPKPAPGAKAPDMTLSDQDLEGGVPAAPGAKAPGMSFTNQDIPKEAPTLQEEPVEPPADPEAVMSTIRTFHARLLDGNTTEMLKLFAGVPTNPAQARPLLQKFTKWGQDIAAGKTDFFPVDVRSDGPAAVVFVDRISIPYNPKDLTVEPWYLVKEGNAWKLLPPLTDYRSGRGDVGIQWTAPSADLAMRFAGLTEQFDQMKVVVASDPFVAVPYAIESAEKVQAERKATWSYGKSSKAPPELELVPGLPAPE